MQDIMLLHFCLFHMIIYASALRKGLSILFFFAFMYIWPSSKTETYISFLAWCGNKDQITNVCLCYKGWHSEWDIDHWGLMEGQCPVLLLQTESLFTYTISDF